MAASQGDHMKVTPGSLVHEHYEILREVGCGNFSKVYEVRDTRAPSAAPHLALKIVKREYANDAAFERDMLKILGAKGVEVNGVIATGAQSVSTMREYFVWNRYPCFIMPLRGPTLRSCKLGIERGHCTRTDVVQLAHSLLTTLKFVHFDCKMVHTDLKPENILLNDTPAIPPAAASVPPQTAVSNGSLGNGWTVCDFGSASLWRVDRMDSDLISTRPYRAPEVVMGNPWSYPADTWSLGCIIYEAAVGSRLFDVHDDNTHLSFMEKRLGRLPDALAKKSKNSRKYFDPSGNLTRPAVRSAQGSASRAVAAARCPRSLQEVLGDDEQLLDLISSMLQYDPTHRIRADDALKHPIFDGITAQPSSSSRKPSPAPKAVLLEKETSLELSKRSTPGPSTASSAVTTPEPRIVPVPRSASVMKPEAAKYRATSTLLACAAAMSDTKENHNMIQPHHVAHPSGSTSVMSGRKPGGLVKSSSSSALTALAKATGVATVQRTNSALATRSSAAQPAAAGCASTTTQRAPSSYANYALRLKVNART